MAVTPSLQLRASQSLVMTEQLQQSIKLLQLSALELSEFIEQEMEKNPLLSTEETNSDETKPEAAEPGGEADAEGEDASSPERDDMYTRSLDMSGEGSREAGTPDTSNDDIWGGDTDSQRYNESDFSGRGSERESTYTSDVIEERFSQAPSLKEHLLQQVQVDIADPEQKLIAAYLIDLLDEAGYLREDVSRLHEVLGCDAAQVEATLSHLRQCDPAGVFAYDLKDCLTLQLREKGQIRKAMESLLQNLELLAEANLRKLTKLCGVGEEELAAMLVVIRALDPRPGSHFSSEQLQTLIPDVLVRKTGVDGWRVELNSEVMPRLLVNRQYHTDLSGRSRSREEKKFLNEQLANASWLVKALDQRAQTLLKVASEIVRQQEMFLEHGIRYMKPMTLRHIAEAVEVHESTVSRITSNKFMATPRGVFPLKYFFSSALTDAADGEGTSSRTVMHMIKEMVGGEAADAVLSDDAIAEKLAEKGIEVARRTVVKYRKIMQIPSSVERRRQARRA